MVHSRSYFTIASAQIKVIKNMYVPKDVYIFFNFFNNLFRFGFLRAYVQHN